VQSFGRILRPEDSTCLVARFFERFCRDDERIGHRAAGLTGVIGLLTSAVEALPVHGTALTAPDP